MISTDRKFDATDAAPQLAAFTIVRLTGEVAMLSARVEQDERLIDQLRHEQSRLNESLRAQGRAMVEMRTQLRESKAVLANLPLDILRRAGLI